MMVLRYYCVSRDMCAMKQFCLLRKISTLNQISLVNSVDNDANVVNIDETARFSDEKMAEKRNKSRLRVADRNLLHSNVPYPQPVAEHHTKIKYLRRMYGWYGDKSGVDPRICWPISEDFVSLKEYESLSRPHSLQEMITMNLERKASEREQVIKREQEVATKLRKLEKWKEELNARIQKREADAVAAKAKKDRLIEEVRRYFGFKVDPRDERFKEMLEKKEREEKKLAKEAKKKAREAKLLSQLAESSVKPEDQKLT